MNEQIDRLYPKGTLPRHREWYCRSCGFLSPKQITNEDTCKVCGNEAIILPIPAELTALRKKNERLETAIRNHLSVAEEMIGPIDQKASHKGCYMEKRRFSELAAALLDQEEEQENG